MITVYRKSDFAEVMGLTRPGISKRSDLPEPTGVSPDGKISYWLGTDPNFVEYVNTRKKSQTMSDS